MKRAARRGLAAVVALVVAAISNPAPAEVAGLGAGAQAGSHSGSVERSPLILVSIDGFRADYLARGLTPTLSSLAADGVRSVGMRPSFPSLTFPNHYTLVTGLYPDHHGVVGNVMDDPKIAPDSRFSVSDFAAVSDPRWWAGAEPLWVTAKRQGVRTATMFWPGSEAPNGGLRPDDWAHFDPAITPDQRVDVVLDWLSLASDRRPGFVTLYFDQVDRAGHEAGPDSGAVDASLGVVDRALARLLVGLEARGLGRSANLLIVADHGMAATSMDRRVFVDDWAPASLERPSMGAALVGFAPRTPEIERRILATHAHARCYRHGSLPPRLHFGTNARISPIVCLAETGWTFTTHDAPAKGGFALGQHGYDGADPLMAALFVAHGPAFRRGAVLPAFDNVDVYPLLAEVLHVTPRPNDGSLAEIRAALVQ